MIGPPVLGISGKYRLEQRLGGGGMAEVFLGATMGAEGFSRRVAIKRVLPGFSDNPAFAQMFVAEAQISSRLVHPNIVSVLDFDRDGEQRLFLVMELVEGCDLDALVSTGLLPVPLVVHVIAEVLRGLGYAHDLPVGTDVRGVVHRDVSPHNVLLSWEGAVKVSDFGIAKARAASEATASVFIKGKPAYMSPEQANGQPLDGRSDLFAVGIMLWEMLVGRRLFIAEDTRATLASVLFGQIARPRALRPEVPKDLERVAMKLLERDLPARYATAEHAIRDLLDCADAPKDGRDLVAKALAERFPERAPVRHSVVRGRAGQAAGRAGQAADRATLPDGAPPRVPAAALPSLGAMRAAPTTTLGPPAASKGKLALLVAATILVGLATFAVVFAFTRNRRAPAPAPSEVAAGSSGALHDAAVAPPPTSDAAATPAARPPLADAATPVQVQVPPPPPPTPPPVDAGAPLKHDPAPPAPPPRGAAKGVGKLHVEAFPVLTVFVDKKRLGETALEVSLAAGKHELRLVNPALPYDETIVVTITDKHTTTITRNH